MQHEQGFVKPLWHRAGNLLRAKQLYGLSLISHGI